MGRARDEQRDSSLSFVLIAGCTLYLFIHCPHCRLSIVLSVDWLTSSSSIICHPHCQSFVVLIVDCLSSSTSVVRRRRPCHPMSSSSISIILAKRMVQNHRNQPQTTFFLSNNNMVKRGGPNGRPYNPPWPLAPQPFRPLFDCCVVVFWDQAA